ncbi:UvrD-helicase domain-containing protein [Nocardia tengchongensis]
MTAIIPNVELDDVQRAIVESPIDARLLVVAGAGQGKTEVVAARIGHLVEAEDLSASAEVLVLSFSRAAVDAVRKRLDTRKVAQANVRTFDSFASRLLVEADTEPTGSFDARIRQATKYLASLTERPYELEDLRHVVVDEIQDLVGDRADFVVAVLRALDDSVGITALGDPLQAVYDFQLEKSKSQSTSGDVFGLLENEFRAHRVTLYTNYRARGTEPKQVIGLGNQLRESVDPVGALDLIRDFDSKLLDLGTTEDWAELLPLGPGRTAVLCTSNADVLRVSRELHKLGVKHVARRAAQEFGAAHWIAPALCGFARMDVTRDGVEEALAALPVGVAPRDAWFLLKSAEGGRNHNSLGLSRLRSLVRSGAIPLALTEPDTADLIVSTVHKAKGLEFDQVLVVDRGVHENEDPWAAVRRRYVALSRARDKVFTSGLVKSYSMFETWKSLGGRNLERRTGRNGKRRTVSMEFAYKDVADDRPFLIEADAERVQQFLRNVPLVGAALEGRLDPDGSQDNMPSYVLVTEDGTTIGRTSETFAQSFVGGFGLTNQPLPTRFSGLSVVSIESTAGEPWKTEEANLGGSGFWLVPRVAGLVMPDWNSRELDSE